MRVRRPENPLAKKNAAHLRGVFSSVNALLYASQINNYFETERRNMRSIFSFVASQQLWLA